MSSDYLNNDSHLVTFPDIDTSGEIETANSVLSIGFRYADSINIQIDLRELSKEYPDISNALASALGTSVAEEIEKTVPMGELRDPLDDFLKIQTWERFVMLKRLILYVDEQPFLFYNPDHAQLSIDADVVGNSFIDEVTSKLEDLSAMVLEYGTLASWNSGDTWYEITPKSLCQYHSPTIEDEEPDSCFQLRHLEEVTVDGDEIRLKWRNDGSVLSKILNSIGQRRPSELSIEQSEQRKRVVSALSKVIGAENIK